MDNKIFLENLPKKNGIGINKNKLTIDWINSIGYKIKFIYDEIEGEFEIIKYDTKNQKIEIKYNNNKFKIKLQSLKKCEFGSILKKLKFNIEINDAIIDNNRDLIIIDRKFIKDKNGRDWKYYKYKCKKCGFNCGEHWHPKSKEYKEELWIQESHLLKGQGCSSCSNHIVVENINSIYKTNPWMIPYIGEECAKIHTKCSGDKVQVTCPDCGRVKDKKIAIHTIKNSHSINCFCSDGKSYVSKYIFNVLEQINAYFDTEKKYNWCNFYNPYKNTEVYGVYDFVIEEKTIIIEADGEFHRNDNKMSGQTKEESAFLDNEKDTLAEEYGYKVIRISDEGNVKENILNSDLSEFFDLSVVDWLSCHEFALSNLVKIACEYKSNNPNLSTNDISKIMKISRHSVRTYFKKGKELEWCQYDATTENKIMLGKKLGKEVEIFKNGISLGVFESCSELSRQSEELFGVKLASNLISAVCIGKNKTSKGYTFKYIEEKKAC